MVSFTLHAEVLGGRPVRHTCKVGSGYSKRGATRSSPRLVPCRAGEESSNGAGKSLISEDVLERLRAAEAEAARLRSELAAAKAESPTQVAEPEAKDAGVKRRIDSGGLRREGLFAAADDWLNESEVSTFITGGAPAESGGETSKQDQDIVKRRLLIGIVATVGLAAFALVPTDNLRLNRPTKPLFLFLIPLIRVQRLLEEVEGLVAEAQWGELEVALMRIQGSPNNMEQNLRDAAASLSSVAEREKAQGVAREVIEDVAAINYNSYYEAMGKPGFRGGQQELMFANFSLQASKAARERLKAFLALMPRESLDAAREQAFTAAF